MTLRADAIERVNRALDDIRQGKMVIVVDDEDRENEGDLCMAAECITPETINFMAKYGRGLICLSLTEEKVKKLDLPMMVDENRSSRGTAFTVSIEARHGVSTGISAADRAHTVRTAVARDARPEDLVAPGHIFPLRARPGGVLQRTGHTEGSIDLARLAGFEPAGVICEIMNDDGTMARYPDLVKFGEEHDVRVISIADLIQYRLQKERLVHRAGTGVLTMPSGAAWTAHVYQTSVEEKQFLALTLGDIAAQNPTLVRVHTGSVLGDVFLAKHGERMAASDAIARIEREGAGVLLFVPGKVNLARDLAFHMGETLPAVPAQEQGNVLREFGLGAQVLVDLGLKRINLLTNRPRRIAGLDGYGLEIVEQVVLDGDTENSGMTTHRRFEA